MPIAQLLHITTSEFQTRAGLIFRALKKKFPERGGNSAFLSRRFDWLDKAGEGSQPVMQKRSLTCDIHSTTFGHEQRKAKLLLI